MSYCMLLKTIPESRLRMLLADGGWCMQQKLDGVRCVVWCSAGKITTMGRNGQPVDLGYVGTQFPTDRTYALDGEFAWGCFYAFDEITEPHKPYAQRLDRANQLVQEWGSDLIRRTPTWRATADKIDAFKRAKDQRVEGVVLKRLEAPWMAGLAQDRAVRFKFVRRAEAVVLQLGAGGRRNAAVGMYDQSGNLQPVGKVPLPRDLQWYSVNQAAERLSEPPVLEVQYLYATEGMQLYQPVFVRVRFDKSPTPQDCPLRQLVVTHKGEMDGGPSQKTYRPKEAAESLQSPVERIRQPSPKLKPKKRKPVNLWVYVRVVLTVFGFALALVLWTVNNSPKWPRTGSAGASRDQM